VIVTETLSKLTANINIDATKRFSMICENLAQEVAEELERKKKKKKFKKTNGSTGFLVNGVHLIRLHPNGWNGNLKK
jgi:succinyl-CoA synthetase beta subunit